MKKKALSCLLVLAALMTASPSVPILAADNTDATGNDTTASVTTQEVTEAGSQGATVKYDQASSFTVTIPKAIKLSGDKTATYQVKVKGDISGNEKVTVVPDSEVTLNDSNGKDPVTGTITQEKTEFSSAEISGGGTDGAVTNGNVAAVDLTAGDWSGTFDFTVGIDKDLTNAWKSVDWMSKAAGLYNLDGTYVDSVDNQNNYDTSKMVRVISDETNYIDSYGALGYSGLVINSSTITRISYSAFSPKIFLMFGPNFNTNCEIASNAGNYTTPMLKTNIISYCDLDPADYDYWDIIAYDYAENGLYYSDTTLIKAERNVKTANIKEGTTIVKAHCFNNCSELESVNIPNSVISIQDYAFGFCGNLTSVRMPDNVTNIGNSAFTFCSKLASVTYKGVTYTNKSELKTALTNNGIMVNEVDPFGDTGLTD